MRIALCWVKRRAEEGRVVFVRDGALVLAHGKSEFSLITLDRVPLTHAGKIKFQVDNVMAAVASTWALGVPASIFAQVLKHLHRHSIRAQGDSTCSK